MPALQVWQGQEVGIPRILGTCLGHTYLGYDNRIWEAWFPAFIGVELEEGENEFKRNFANKENPSVVYCDLFLKKSLKSNYCILSLQ